MKIEDQVCSLELAKRLKELGVKQDSFSYWVDHGDHEPYIEEPEEGEPQEFEISAFSVAELGEMLPTWVGTIRIGGEIEKWMGSLERLPGNMDPFRHFISDTEAEARAKMLVYLIENKLVAP